MFDWVIFDFDGTLADTIPAWIALVNKHASEYGYRQIMPKDYPKYRGQTSLQIANDLGVSLVRLPMIALRLKKEFTRLLPEQEMHSGIAEILPRVREKKIKMGIFTSNSRENVTEFLKRHQVGEYFEFVHSENTIFGKGRGLRHLIDQHGINRDRCLYVGDETRDVEGATAAGLRAVSVTWGIHSRTALAAFSPWKIIDTPAGLLSIL